jgi:hypothetical protein
MEGPRPRWVLLDTSTNAHGVTFFSLSCRDAKGGDGDYKELVELLKRQLGAVETGELLGPYSVHKFLKVWGLRVGLVLEWPDWLDLYAEDQRDTPALASLVAEALVALNAREGP